MSSSLTRDVFFVNLQKFFCSFFVVGEKKGVGGIEPPSLEPQSNVLPLNYTPPLHLNAFSSRHETVTANTVFSVWFMVKRNVKAFVSCFASRKKAVTATDFFFLNFPPSNFCAEQTEVHLWRPA